MDHYPTHGSGQEVFKHSRVGSGRVGWSYPTRPASLHSTREQLWKVVFHRRGSSSEEIPHMCANITLGDKITHPLGRISDATSSPTATVAGARAPNQNGVF